MKKQNIFYFFLLSILLILLCFLVYKSVKTEKAVRILSEQVANQKHLFDVVNKKNDDIQIFNILREVAYVDKVRITGPPHHNPKKRKNPFHNKHIHNDMIFYSYTMIPIDIDENNKYPLIVLPHGGIHGTFSLAYIHIIKELLAQGYIVVAPDYRGSIGYGKKAYENIDYGGLENEDALISRDYMVENYSFVDSERIGIVGWSHGGMISLFNILKYPDKYTCAFAGVPVSDVSYRLEYRNPSYSKHFSADYHIGQSIAENPEEYKRRSPVSYANLLEKPLMITTTENDDDVSVLEVQRMIDSLLHYNKDFEYEVYGPTSGAHLFDRLDTKEASDIRFRTYKFLETYLNPPYPFNSENEMRKASYGF